MVVGTAGQASRVELWGEDTCMHNHAAEYTFSSVAVDSFSFIDSYSWAPPQGLPVKSSVQVSMAR